MRLLAQKLREAKDEMETERNLEQSNFDGHKNVMKTFSSWNFD